MRKLTAAAGEVIVSAYCLAVAVVKLTLVLCLLAAGLSVVVLVATLAGGLAATRSTARAVKPNTPSFD